MMEKREMLLAGGFSSYERTANAGTAEPAEVSPAEPVVYWGKLWNCFSFVGTNFPKKRIWISARIPPQTPPAGGKSAEAKRKILFPRKTDFRFAESVLKPHALPEYLEG